MQKDLTRKIGQATKWSGITEIATKLVTPLTNLVLVRLLAPEAFGVVTTLTMVISFAEIFTDAGFQKFLVQHHFENEDELNLSTNVAFCANFCLSLILWLVIAIFAKPIASLVGSEGHEVAIAVIGMEIPLLAFSSIQMARFRRDFDFKGLFVARIATAFAPLVVTVPLTLIFRNYWALVLGTLTKDVLNAVILTARSKWKPGFRFSFRCLKDMLSFSLWTMAENIALWATSYADVFFIGNVLSAHFLGLYKTTMSTTNSYMGLVTAVTSPVLFAALSRCQDDEEGFLNIFFRFQRSVALVVFPLGVGVFLYRDLVTYVLLGKQWLEIADFLGIWSLTSAIAIIFSHYNNDAFRSKGKPKLALLGQILHLVALVPVLIWGVNRGFQTLTVVRSAIRFQAIAVSVIIARVAIGIRLSAVIKNVWPPVVASVVMAGVSAALQMISRNIVWEFVSIAICMAVYIVAMLLIPAGRRMSAEIDILNKVFKIDKIDKRLAGEKRL